MADMIIKPTGTAASMEAVQIYYAVETAMQQAATAMVDVCRNLKTMRDRKLYTELGFETFESYVEQAHHIKQRQAYTYIQTYEKLSARLMEANADLGITKLSLLCQVSAIDREDFIEENDLANITVAEMEKLIEEKNGLHQQISMLESAAETNSEKQTAQDREIDRLKKELAEKNDIIADLSCAQEPIDTAAVDSAIIEEAVAKARQQFEAEKADAVQAAVKAEKEKAKVKLAKEQEKAAQEAVAQAKAQWQEQAEKDSGSLAQELAKAKEQAANLERQLSVKGDDNTVKFSILFEQVQRDIMDCCAVLEAIADTDKTKADKYREVLKNACLQALGGEV